MLNFLGRDSPPTIPNSSKLAARFQPDTRKCTEVQSTLSISECNPSFNRVYVTSREDPSSPLLFEVCPGAGGKTIVRAKFRAFYRSRILPRDSLETRSRASKGKERKGRKERKKESGRRRRNRWRRTQRGKGRGEICIYKRDSFIKDSVSFQLFSLPDSIFLGRNDLRPLLLPVRKKAWKTRLEKGKG